MVDVSEYAYGVGDMALPGGAEKMKLADYRISLTHSFADIADIWKSFEESALCTPFQHYHWLESWQREIGRHKSVTPCLFHGTASDGTTLFILPLAYWRHPGTRIRILGWLGDEHSNYKMGLFRREWVKMLTPHAADEILNNALGFLPQIDLIRLCAGPGKWEGISNPFTKTGALPSASHAHAISLVEDFEALYAARRSAATIKKARKRERSFNRRHPLEPGLARKPDEIRKILDEMFRQKEFRLAEMGVHNFFSNKGMKEFFTENALFEQSGKEKRFHLFYLKAGGEIAATWIGISHRGRMCGMMNTMSNKPELRKHSPGEVLLRHAIKYCCENGFHTFDLAVGESRYKSEWCDQSMTLYETIVPVTLKGHVHKQAAKLRLKAKRLIKQSGLLWPLCKRLRAWTACSLRMIFNCAKNRTVSGQS